MTDYSAGTERLHPLHDDGGRYDVTIHEATSEQAHIIKDYAIACKKRMSWKEVRDGR